MVIDHWGQIHLSAQPTNAKLSDEAAKRAETVIPSPRFLGAGQRGDRYVNDQDWVPMTRASWLIFAVGRRRLR